MKLLLCSDIRLGAICTENLDVKQSHKWQTARTEKFEDLIDKAAQNNASYVMLFGQMFGQERVSESVIDSLFDAVKDDQDIQVLAFLTADEYNRINYRNDIPANLHLISAQTDDSYTDDNIALRLDKGQAEIQLSDNGPIFIKKNGEGRYILSGLDKDQTVPSFEPIGFEDAQEMNCGFGILKWAEQELGQYAVVDNKKYAFKAIELKILPGDAEKDILRKLNVAVKDIDIDTFLRITIIGRSAFGLTLNGDALENQLQSRIFFVEVYDNTIMDIDEEAFENDISLCSEFVRLALQDDSLSESERSRLISCGWNALNGKEVSAE